MDLIQIYIQPGLFLLLSLLIGYFARDWLQQRLLHGLTRFLALECALGLTILSLPALWRMPSSPLQFLSWTLILLSLILGVFGYRLLVQVGKPELRLAADQQLSASGLYKYVRHPLYTSLILFSLALYLKAITMISTALFLGTALFLFITASEEEMENLDRYGVEYARYLDASKMFVPFVF